MLELVGELLATKVDAGLRAEDSGELPTTNSGAVALREGESGLPATKTGAVARREGESGTGALVATNAGAAALRDDGEGVLERTGRVTGVDVGTGREILTAEETGRLKELLDWPRVFDSGRTPRSAQALSLHIEFAIGISLQANLASRSSALPRSMGEYDT